MLDNYTIKVDGVKHTIPETWGEITTKQYLELQTLDPDDKLFSVKWFAIMINASYEEVKHLKGDVIIWMQHCQNAMAHDMPDLTKLAKKKTFRWKGKEYKIPQDLGRYSIAQKIAFEHLIKLEDDKVSMPPENMVEAIAIYLQPFMKYDENQPKDKRFDEDYVAEVMKEVEQMPIVLTYPISNFFFHSSLSYKSIGTMSLLRYQSKLIRRILRNLLRRKGSTNTEI